jgi:hypothetical protein
MANLTSFVFTNQSDKAISSNGWYLEFYEQALSLAGDDLISSVNSSFAGISNQGEIQTGTGNDTLHAEGVGNGLINGIGGRISTDAGSDKIIGIGAMPNDALNSGFGIANRGAILTGSHDDFVSAIGRRTGLFNGNQRPDFDAIINTGAGNDTIEASGHIGISNYGVIYTSLGNDIIHGTGFAGIVNTQGIIDTHTGNDVIRSTGHLHNELAPWDNETRGQAREPTISLGAGNDRIEVKGGLRNDGIIDTNTGDDVITLQGDVEYTYVNYNIGKITLGDGNDLFANNRESLFKNDGIIHLGAGADIMDAMSQGFTGSGTIDLGSGNDTWKGFSSGNNTSNPYRGGTGMDTLTFKPGTYSVVRQRADQYLIGGSMSVIGFERFGSGAGFLTLSAAAASGSVTFNL